MARRNRPGKRERMAAKANAAVSSLSTNPRANYGRSCADIKATDFHARMGARKWQYNGATAGRIHRQR